MKSRPKEDTMVKFRNEKSCSCAQCRAGSKKWEKVASHRSWRKTQRQTTKAFLTGKKSDWEAGPHGAGYWD